MPNVTERAIVEFIEVLQRLTQSGEKKCPRQISTRERTKPEKST